MKRLLLATTGTIVVSLIAVCMAVGSIQQGIVAPPQGALDLGPLRMIGMRPCPQVWPPLGWNRPCGDDRPWTLQAIIYWPGGDVWQREVLRLRIRRGGAAPTTKDASLPCPPGASSYLHIC